MKKLLALMMSFIMILATLTLFTGCGGGEEAEEAADTYTITLAHVEAEDRSTHQAALKFKEAVEEQTEGAVTVEIHANAELGGDTEIVESTANGTIQMCLPSTSVFTAYDPTWGILDMPFLFTSQDAAFAAIDGDLGAQLKDGTNEQGLGFSILGYTYNGPRSMTNSVRPINTPADCEGLKMRTMESPVYISMFESLGASALPMSFSELYTSLQQGTVDGQENPPTLIYASNFHEVQDYLSVTQHVHNFLGVVINTDFFNGLPEEYQTIIQDASDTYFTAEQREMELADNETILETLQEAGMEVNEVSPENIQLFVEAMADMYAQYEEEFGAEIFELARSYNE